VIVAGFGSDEIFPTLIEFEVIGMLGGALKFRSLEHVDIDRNGDRARVLPFAQREMVDRFLYGVDRGIERDVRTFCQRTVTKISDHIIGQMELSNDEANQLMDEAMNAEKIFLDGLQNEGFSAIRENSQHEIEDMVEFMPKSEMARMAEALVNLTSIKRRVSRGIETVGGPIDVAVISKAEGFVWVKRKHYFPAELNARYFDRINR
jgi:polyhydroxyalkanoate synthesis regulator phasin